MCVNLCGVLSSSKVRVATTRWGGAAVLGRSMPSPKRAERSFVLSSSLRDGKAGSSGAGRGVEGRAHKPPRSPVFSTFSASGSGGWRERGESERAFVWMHTFRWPFDDKITCVFLSFGRRLWGPSYDLRIFLEASACCPHHPSRELWIGGLPKRSPPPPWLASSPSPWGNAES